jgi:hypothetical protein
MLHSMYPLHRPATGEPAGSCPAAPQTRDDYLPQGQQRFNSQPSVTAHCSRSACTNACGRLPRSWRCSATGMMRPVPRRTMIRRSTTRRSTVDGRRQCEGLAARHHPVVGDPAARVAVHGWGLEPLAASSNPWVAAFSARARTDCLAVLDRRHPSHLLAGEGGAGQAAVGQARRDLVAEDRLDGAVPTRTRDADGGRPSRPPRPEPRADRSAEPAWDGWTACSDTS